MNNKDILSASLLDIVFENRNKDYGAYALRKYYPRRMEWALGIGIGTVALILVVIRPSQTTEKRPGWNAREIIVSNAPRLKTTAPPIAQTHRTEASATRQIESVSNIRIDVDATDVPDNKDFDAAQVSDHSSDGTKYSDQTAATASDAGGSGGNQTSDPQKTVVFSSSEAQYPGGTGAFMKFMARNLVTPGDMSAGEKKIVLIRFVVDTTGVISAPEIVQSDGEAYSWEVMRVLHKMPKWVPATQNGVKVKTWFTQPVSFIGIEQ